jgi:protein ImuB
MTLWLYLHFPSLQLDSVLQEPETPMVIVDGHQHSVVQLNEPAAARGISVGMGLATAAALCRDIRMLPYRREQELDRLREIAQWLYCVSADIALEEPDGLLLRVTSMLKLYRDLPRYWQALRKPLDTLQLRYQYATGYSPPAARMLARAGFNRLSDDAHELRQHWTACNLRQTQLLPEHIEKLERVGLHRVADLLSVPLKALSRRFGVEVVRYVGQLTGELKHPVVFYHSPEDFRQTLELLYDIENTQALQAPLAHLLASLEGFLRLRDQVTAQITFQLHQRDSSPLPVTVGSVQGEYRAETWLELTKLTLENRTLDGPIYALSLRVAHFQDKATSSEDLFAGKQGKLSGWQLVSLLQARLGKARVTGLCRVDDFRPELASADCAPLQPHAQQQPPALLRPSLLLPEPKILREPVAIVHGPERIATGWWDQQPLMRDYYIARNKNGQWYWVFRTPATESNRQHWYLHGYFS